MNLRTFVAFAALGLGMTAAVDARAATTFTFQFDNGGIPNGQPDGTVGTPHIGTGSFVSPADLGPGVYALSSLSGFSVNFTIGSENFTTADISTPIGQVAVGITAFGSGERLVFTENGSPADGGPYGGALDLTNPGGALLTFEPSWFGGNNLYSSGIFGGASYSGNYLATSDVASAPGPESGTGVFSLGLLLVALATVKARRFGFGER